MGVAGLTLPQVKSHLQKYRNVSPPSQPPSPKRRRTRGTLPAPAPPLPPPLPPPPEMWPCGGARALEALPPDGPAGGLPTLLEAALILEASNEAAAQHPIPAALPPSPPQQHLPPPVGPVGGCAPPPPPPPPPPGPGRLSLVAQPPLLPSTVLVRPHNLALTGGGSPLGANGLVQRAARSGLPNAVAAAEALNAERLAWMAAGQLLNDSRHTTGQQQDQQEAAAAAGALGGGGGGLAAAATAAAAAAAAAAGPTFASAAQQGAPAQPHAFPREAEQGGCALRVACGLQALLQQQAALTAALRASLRQDLAALLPVSCAPHGDGLDEEGRRKEGGRKAAGGGGRHRVTPAGRRGGRGGACWGQAGRSRRPARAPRPFGARRARDDGRQAVDGALGGMKEYRRRQEGRNEADAVVGCLLMEEDGSAAIALIFFGARSRCC
jgi:hypothetical protein